MRKALRLTALLPLAAALVLALPGCQSESERPPIVVITPQPVRGVIAQTSFSGFQSDVWVSIEVFVSQRGVLDVTVDWTSSDAWIYVYLGQTSCDYPRLASRNCPFMISSETKTPKPRVLTTGTIEPGKYYLVLYNVPRNVATGIGSDATESVAIQLGLTVTASGQRTSDVVHLGTPQVVQLPRP